LRSALPRFRFHFVLSPLSWKRDTALQEGWNYVLPGKLCALLKLHHAGGDYR
jgi:hypothetical protein